MSEVSWDLILACDVNEVANIIYNNIFNCSDMFVLDCTR